jgi:hypothetical protein
MTVQIFHRRLLTRVLYVGTVVDTGVTDPYLFDFYLQVSSRRRG